MNPGDENNMGTNETVEWRLQQLERANSEMKHDITFIKEILTKLSVKFESYSPSSCVMHTSRLSEMEKEIQHLQETTDSLKNTTDGLTRKIVAWTAIFTTVLFLLSNLIVPYVLQNYRITTQHPTEHSIK